MKQRVGRQVTELRTDAGITMAQLARCAGLDASHIWRIEAGETTPSIEALGRHRGMPWR